MAPLPTYILGAAHTLVGAGVLFAPLATAHIFGIAAVPSMNFISRLFGTRDLLVGGGVLATANEPKPQRRLVLLAANIMNAIDIVSGLVTYAEGNLSDRALVLGPSGATIAFILGMVEIGRL